VAIEPTTHPRTARSPKSYVCSTKDGKYVAESSKHLLPQADIGRSCIRFKRIDDVDLDALARDPGGSEGEAGDVRDLE
jgi:hypothetical protein